MRIGGLGMKVLRRSLLSYLCCACLLLPSVALSQQKPPTKEELARAKESFYKGEAFFRVQEYDKALEAYKEAYLLTHQGEILFNMGHCYRFLGRYEEALEVYVNFLRDVPESPLVPEVQSLVQDVKKEIAAAATRPTSAPNSITILPTSTTTIIMSSTQPVEPPRTFSTKLYVSGGAALLAGAALGVVGLVGAIGARDEQDGGSQNAALLNAQRKRAIFLGAAADLCFVGGGAIVGFGLYRDLRPDQTSEQGVSVSIRF